MDLLGSEQTPRAIQKQPSKQSKETPFPSFKGLLLQPESNHQRLGAACWYKTAFDHHGNHKLETTDWTETTFLR